VNNGISGDIELALEAVIGAPLLYYPSKKQSGVALTRATNRGHFPVRGVQAMKEVRRLLFASVGLVLLCAGVSQAGQVMTPTIIHVNPHPVIVNSHPSGGVIVHSHHTGGMTGKLAPHVSQSPQKPHTHLPPVQVSQGAQVAGNCGAYAKAKQCEAHWNGQRCTCGN
jgi:hypothetical protein